MALLRAEVLRLVSRRMARVFAAIAVLIVLIVTVRSFVVSDRDLAAARRRSVAAAAQAERDQARAMRQFAASCEQDKARGQIPPEVDCTEVFKGNAEGPQFQAADYYRDPRLSARTALPGGARGVAGGIAVVAFLVGASFIGAEWNAGTLQALLFWEPRRPRVLLAKALALVAVTIAFTAVVQLFTYGMTFLTASTRGSTEGVTAGLQISVLLTILRGMLMVSITALLGFAVAGLARVTAAALGAAFAYFVIIENLIRGLRPGWQRYLFTENVSAVLLKKIPVMPAGARSLDGLDESLLYQLTAFRGIVTLTVYLGLLLGVFYVTFTRRDVT
jgi:ABC-type transport system involved in multi-copper enzyme maturation permease subunit